MSKEDAERVQQTEALQDLMGKKMAIWKEILSAARDMDRKEGLKQYRTMAAEELRIIARNVSKTKLRELTDQKINYFSQVGISDSDDKKIANMQGFRQVGDEERLLCALEAPEVAPRVFPDVALDEASLAKLGTLPPGAFGGQAGPVRKQESFTSLVGDTAVLERLEDQVSILEKAALQSRNGERATPYGGVIRQGPPPLPLSPAQLMQQAQMMSARLPKRRLPPIGQSPQVEHKSRLVSEFVEKLAEEIAANRISKSEARKQLKDIVEMENELTETLVSATTVRPDVTEDKLQAIAEMYKEISSTIISNPEMNREEAMNKLKRVAAMEHELTQALVPDEVFPYQQKSAEDSMIKLQQMKLNLTDELQRNMAVSQPDADRVQESIKKLYELELKLMDKLFTAKSERNGRHERGPRRDRDGDDGKRLYLKSKRRPTTTIELSLGPSSDHEDDNIVPMIPIKPPQSGREGLEKAGKSCPVHGNRTMPCRLHPKDKKKDPSCPVHSERLRTTLSWTVSPGDGGDASDRTTRERSGVNHQMENKHPEREQRSAVAYPEQHRQPQELGVREPPVEREPADGAERYIVPTRYQGMQQERVRNEDENSYFGATGNYNKQSWDTAGQEVPQHYMPQDFPLIGFGDDSERPPPPRWRKRRSRTSQRSRRSYNENAAEEVPPGLPFWDWICKSICNLLPFARDESGNKSRRGVGIQELVNEVMATSEEVVQAKRQLQSSDGNPEASVRSMGDLEGKLWKLIDLEVDLVNELARYRWSGDVQDPRAEIKLNNAEEKIWKVIGVQKRLAQDLGEWRKNSTRTFQTRAPDPVAVAQPLSYGYEANYNPVNYDNLMVYGDPANFNANNRDNMGGYVNSGNQGVSGNPAVSDGRDNPNLGTSREAEESTQPPMTRPKVKKQSSKQSKMSKASKASRKSKRSTRASRKKQRKQQSLSNDVSPAATPVKRTKSRNSSKKRSRSRDLSPDTTTSNTTTNTSVQSSGGSTSEYSTDSTDITSTVVTEPDSITIATTIVLSSEMDDAEGNQRPSAVSWKSPSKEFLSSIDRSQVTPVEWETKRKGKYIYVRPRQGGSGRKPVRSASHSPPKARKPRAHPNARRHSAGPKDSFELYGTNGSRHGRDHRGHAVDCRNSSYYKTDRRPSPHRHSERPKSHIYAGPPEYSRMPRENNSVAYHHEGKRRRYRSMGPHSSRSERRSRSQWSV
ncbi:uncharacterized protein ISCGN_012164 [Ixodes scapularis]